MQVSREDIIEAVESAGLIVDLSNIGGGDSLRGAGLDSLEAMSFFLAIEEKFNVKFPDEDVDSLDSIDSIVEYMINL